ncbi:hypothetical protein N7452_010971 [Penicillium brevicompactum]|uniref:Uncharacterized protein n=1 Tax=Penicillium brevicompactum TaxID=5074 RepID=A0A9W9U740_PENBR|nr:hypothetical protein N7452_010971 [Penicillium brevicompactum]
MSVPLYNDQLPTTFIRQRNILISKLRSLAQDLIDPTELTEIQISTHISGIADALKDLEATANTMMTNSSDQELSSVARLSYFYARRHRRGTETLTPFVWAGLPIHTMALSFEEQADLWHMGRSFPDTLPEHNTSLSTDIGSLHRNLGFGSR